MFNEVIIEKKYTHIISVAEPCIPGNVSIVALFIFMLFNFLTATWWGWRYYLQSIECLRAASSRTLALACVYLVCLFTCVCAEAHAYVCLCVVYTWLRRQVSSSAILYYTEAGALGEPGAHRWFWEVRQPSCPRSPCPCLQCCADNFSGFHMGSRDPDSAFYLLSHLSSPARVLWVGKGTIHNPTGTRG